MILTHSYVSMKRHFRPVPKKLIVQKPQHPLSYTPVGPLLTLPVSPTYRMMNDVDVFIRICCGYSFARLLSEHIYIFRSQLAGNVRSSVDFPLTYAPVFIRHSLLM